MREIKFRQYCKSSKTFRYWGYIIDHPLEENYGKYFQSPLGPMDNDRRKSDQYIGLKDKNGKEIYEGDIIVYHRVFTSGNYAHHVGQVIYEAYRFTVSGFYEPFFDYPSEAFSEGTEKMELIGNIYENPELLEVDKSE